MLLHFLYGRTDTTWKDAVHQKEVNKYKLNSSFFTEGNKEGLQLSQRNNSW